MLRRFALLIAITTVLLLAVIAVNLTNLSIAKAAPPADAQKWEYALMVTFVLDKTFNAVPVAPDESETDDLTAAFKDLSKMNLLTTLNVMGDAGWEMVSVQTESSVTTYTFKRPASDS